MTAYLYITAVIALLFFLISASCYLIMMAYSLYNGAPYVATDLAKLKKILDKTGLKKGKRFVDLGCGDGRVVRFALSEYEISGTGVDKNPILIWLARFRSRSFKTNQPAFVCADVTRFDLREMDIVYLFLFPKLILALQHSFLSCKKGTMIVSHGFRIPYLEEKMTYKFDVKPFSTYLYQL